jgi:hypothetical protein
MTERESALRVEPGRLPATEIFASKPSARPGAQGWLREEFLRVTFILKCFPDFIQFLAAVPTMRGLRLGCEDAEQLFAILDQSVRAWDTVFGYSLHNCFTDL